MLLCVPVSCEGLGFRCGGVCLSTGILMRRGHSWFRSWWMQRVSHSVLFLFLMAVVVVVVVVVAAAAAQQQQQQQ